MLFAKSIKNNGIAFPFLKKKESFSSKKLFFPSWILKITKELFSKELDSWVEKNK